MPRQYQVELLILSHSRSLNNTSVLYLHSIRLGVHT
ncbi:uncharacterized protein FIBRA_06837 [Fibroporia radiculosa]|uniref:Uncharacterized protein n=1 Tax=Fibroporia radiculosa TaxID=599839 RepID=J4GCN0_9APHY|nr:uncharacterized protein FIBRA_06837 [Fibroporia radiculosa]CCM04653.1 predicted protein [Fibroporia radiculosa]